MHIILILLLIGLMIMVVVSLVRGIIAFLQSTKLDLEGDDERMRANQLKQNKAMQARILYQFGAIAVVALILLLAS